MTATVAATRLVFGEDGQGINTASTRVPNSARDGPGMGGNHFFSPQQKADLATLADLIIPADNVSLGAKGAKAEDYIDFIVATAPAEEQRAWVEGLRGLNEWSHARYGNPFRESKPEDQRQLLEEMVQEEASPKTLPGRFFVRAKHATADAFYTSRIGLTKDLKYQGNTYVDAPATCLDQFESAQAGQDKIPGNLQELKASCPHARKSD